MVEEIITLFGQTNGTTTTGTFTLTGDLLATGVTSILIPAGMVVKIWARRLSGAACIVNYQVNHVPPPSPPVYTTISSNDLSSAGEIDLEKRRPIVIRGLSGFDTVQITWTQASAAVSSVEFEVVFDEYDEW